MLAGEPPFRGRPPRDDGEARRPRRHVPSRALRPDVPAGSSRAVDERSRRIPRIDSPRHGVRRRARSRAQLAASVRGRAATTRTIAVLPFVNASPDPDNEYLSDGITDELINALAKVEGLRVASRTSVFALKGKPQDVRAIGALLGASRRPRGHGAPVGRSAAHHGAAHVDRRRPAALVAAVRPQAGRRVRDSGRDRAHDRRHAARDVVRRSRSRRRRERYTRATCARTGCTCAGATSGTSARRKACGGDPLLRAGDRRGSGLRAGVHRTRRLVRAAPRLPQRAGARRVSSARSSTRGRRSSSTSTLAEAHASLAWMPVHLRLGLGRGAHASSGARSSSIRATRRRTSGTRSCWRRSGRIDEALVEAHTAQELDPASVSVRRTLGWLYFYARRYEQARYHLARRVAMNPDGRGKLPRARVWRWRCRATPYEAERVLREAVALPVPARTRPPTLGYVLGACGQGRRGARLLADLERVARAGVRVAGCVRDAAHRPWQRGRGSTGRSARTRSGAAGWRTSR